MEHLGLVFALCSSFSPGNSVLRLWTENDPVVPLRSRFPLFIVENYSER